MILCPSHVRYATLHYTTLQDHDMLIDAHTHAQSILNNSLLAVFPQRDVSEIRSATLTQFLLNWTLAEVGDMYRSKNTSLPMERPEFDVTDVEDWYQHVVMPLLQRFLPNDEALMHQNIKLAFHEVLYVLYLLISYIYIFVLDIVLYIYNLNILL